MIVILLCLYENLEIIILLYDIFCFEFEKIFIRYYSHNQL